MSAAVRRKRGRPPRVIGERATERIWAYVTPRERELLERVVEEMPEGKSVGEVVRDAVNEYVADFADRRVFSSTGKSSMRLL